LLTKYFCKIKNNYNLNEHLVEVGKSLRLLTLFQFVGALFAPFFLPTLCWINPCSAQFFGSILFCSEEVDGSHKLEIYKLIFIYVLEVILFYGPAQVTGSTYIIAVLFAEFLNQYTENLKRYYAMSLTHSYKT